MKYRFFLLIIWFVPALSLAQDVSPAGSDDLAAHPDDEDGRTLTYYRHAKNAVAYSVIYTRGEGGQNEIGPELYEALGAIRTPRDRESSSHSGYTGIFPEFQRFWIFKKKHPKPLMPGEARTM